MTDGLKPSYEYMQPMKYIGKVFLEKRTSEELSFVDFETDVLRNLNPPLNIDVIKIMSGNKVSHIIAIKFWVEPASPKTFNDDEIHYLRQYCEENGVKVSYLLVEFPQELHLNGHNLHPIPLY